MLKNKRFIIFLILTLLWMAMIFYMSSQPAVESAALSGGIGEWLAGILVPDHSSWSAAEWLDYVDLIDHLIRKAAHFTEYAILGAFLSADLFLFQKKEKSKQLSWRMILLVAWLIGTVYAMTDEFHQLFVEGRSGEVFDVLLDSSGVFVGCLIVSLIGARLRRKHDELRL